MKEKKNRIPIPKELAAEILYEFDRTCCVCSEKGKSVQIHHIDENPGNNSKNNLTVLCFDCHEETQVKGGFGRKLDAPQVLKYKSEWLERVCKRRQEADQLASLKTIANNENASEPEYATEPFFEDPSVSEEIERQNYENEQKLFENYTSKIIDLKAVVYKYARVKWDSGVASKMRGGTSEVIDFYEEVLSELTTFYPYNHFGENAKAWVNDMVAARFTWHRAVFGVYGRIGTMDAVVIGGRAMVDIDNMVQEMVCTLAEKYGIRYEEWGKQWTKIK
jgi:hypothetical protein